MQPRFSIRLFYICFLLLIVAGSCTSAKKIIYFQDINKAKADTVNVASIRHYLIQPGDILQITVSSSSAEADQLFNFNNRPDGSSANTLSGIIVDTDGFIDLPYAGRFRIAQLNSMQARDTIQSKLAGKLKDPVVNFRIANFQVSVLGDVAKPGTYAVSNEKINILQAISLAGDLNITAKRDNIVVIRQENGKEIFARVDIRSKNLVNSAFFNLRSNDMVYVEPSKGKITQNDNRTFQIATLGATILSLVTIILIRADL